MRLSHPLAFAALVVAAFQPIAASATTPVTASQKLSLRNVVPADARVSPKPGKNKAIGAGLIILIVAGVAGVVAVAASGGSDSN